MRHLGFLIAFLGLLQLFSAAPGRVKRQTNMSLVEKCQSIFHVACDELKAVNTEPLPAVPKTADCECVRFYQCTNGTLNVDGYMILNKRISPCPKLTEVCCKKASIMPTKIVNDDSAAILWPQHRK